MAHVSEHVIHDMQDGVLVVDGEGVIRQFNTRAERILGPMPEPSRRRAVANTRRPSRGDSPRGERTTGGAESAADMNVTGEIGARIVPVGRRRSAGAVIFLEDRTRIQNEARQMKLAALGRLTANIAHEIRNPLGAISHATELLQEEPPSTDTAQAAHHDHPRQHPAPEPHGERRAASCGAATAPTSNASRSSTI